MSWATCNGASNNIHLNFPPIMNDGRNFANWYPGAVINENIRKNLNVKSDFEYRQYLINNADKIIKNNQFDSCNDCGYCPSKFESTDFKVTGKNSPFVFNNQTKNTKPYGYEESDLKNIYLSRNELQSKMYSKQFIFNS